MARPRPLAGEGCAPVQLPGISSKREGLKTAREGSAPTPRREGRHGAAPVPLAGEGCGPRPTPRHFQQEGGLKTSPSINPLSGIRFVTDHPSLAGACHHQGE